MVYIMHISITATIPFLIFIQILGGMALQQGSADGSIIFYDYASSDMIFKHSQVHQQVTSGVEFHPKMSNVLASCGWDHAIKLFI